MVIDPLPAVGWDGLLQNNVPGNHLFITGKGACVPSSDLHGEKMEDATGQDRINQYSDSTSPSAIELKDWCFLLFRSLWIKGGQELSLGQYKRPWRPCSVCKSKMIGRFRQEVVTVHNIWRLPSILLCFKEQWMLGFARTGHPHCHGQRMLHSPRSSRDAYTIQDHPRTRFRWLNNPYSKGWMKAQRFGPSPEKITLDLSDI